MSARRSAQKLVAMFLSTKTFLQTRVPAATRVYRDPWAGVPRNSAPEYTLYYAIVFPGRKSGFRAAIRPDSSRESVKIGSPAGLRPAGGAFRTRIPISGPEALLHNIYRTSCSREHAGSRVYLGPGHASRQSLVAAGSPWIVRFAETESASNVGGSYTGTTDMAQTGCLAHRYGVFRICTIPVGLVAAFWVAERSKNNNNNNNNNN